MKKLTILFSSMAMLFGVGLGVGAAVKGEAKVEKAEAVSFGAGTNIYLAGSGDIDITGSVLSAWVHYGSGSHWESFEYDALSGYYMITLDSSASALTFARTQNKSDGGTNWGDVGNVYNQTDMSFESNKNWIWPKSWSNSITCEWRYIHYHIGGSFNNWVMNDSSYKMTDGFDDDGGHQASISLTTTADNVTLKAATLYNGTTTMNYYGELEPGYNSQFIGNDSSGNIQLKKAGTYELYLKSDRKVWAQVSSATEANEYALTFLSTISCTNTSTTFSMNAWNTVGSETTSMEYKFSQLTTGAKNVLKGASANPSGSNVEQCIARYERVLYKYGYGEGDSKYHDFMERKPATISGSTIIPNIIDDKTTNATLATVIITIVSLAAVGGFFFLRKKKLSK